MTSSISYKSADHVSNRQSLCCADPVVPVNSTNTEATDWVCQIHEVHKELKVHLNKAKEIYKLTIGTKEAWHLLSGNFVTLPKTSAPTSRIYTGLPIPWTIFHQPGNLPSDREASVTQISQNTPTVSLILDNCFTHWTQPIHPCPHRKLSMRHWTQKSNASLSGTF